MYHSLSHDTLPVRPLSLSHPKKADLLDQVLFKRLHDYTLPSSTHPVGRELGLFSPFFFIFFCIASRHSLLLGIILILLPRVWS